MVRLQPETMREIQELISEAKPNDADLLAALHRLRKRFGFIPPESIPLLARQFHLTQARIYAVITFYSEFHLTPPPRTTIGWCSGPACRLKGSEGIRVALEATLGTELGGETSDNGVGLHEAQCDGSCHMAPLVWVNGRVNGDLDTSKAIRLGRSLMDQEQQPGEAEESA